MSRLSVFVCGLFALSTTAFGASFAENFDSLPSMLTGGWSIVNNSSPVGTTSWFQGNSGVFAAHSGAPDSYVAANFENAALGGAASTWLISPLLTIDNNDLLEIYTRAPTGSVWVNHLEIRMSSGGADVGATASSVGDFTTLLQSIITPNYPETWKSFKNTFSTGGPVSARIAFRHVIADTNFDGDYVGVDSMRIDQSTVPEPSSIVLVGSSLFGAFWLARRRRG